MEHLSKNNEVWIRLDKDEDLFGSLIEIASQYSIKTGWISGLGALKDVELAYYDLEEQKYLTKVFHEDMELLNLTGNISTVDKAPFLHLHGTLGRKDYSCIGGHFMKAKIAVLGEILITSSPIPSNRLLNCSIGLKALTFKD